MKSAIIIIRRDSEIYKVLENDGFDLSPGRVIVLSDEGMKTLEDDFRIIQFEMEKPQISKK